MRTSTALAALAVFALGLAAPNAAAQFGVPSPTNFKERIAGEFLASDGAPAPEAGDQIGAFYQTQIIGRFVYESTARDFEILLYGDDLNTQAVEGPRKGQAVQFRFYDSSANQTIDLDVLNNRGERFNFNFQGEEVPPLPINLPGLDLTPTRGFDLRVAGDDGNGGGGGGNDSGIRYDVNNDGKINNEDAAVILRLVAGGASLVPSDQRRKADVNGDGVVNTADAIEVMRNR